MSVVVVLDPITADSFSATLSAHFNTALAQWAGNVCNSGPQGQCSQSDVQSHTVNGAMHSVSITSTITTASWVAAQESVRHMNELGVEGLQMLLRRQGIEMQSDALSQVTVTLLNGPVLGQLPPLAGAVYVIGTVTLRGLDKSLFTTTDQGNFRQVVAEHAGSVCGHGSSSCHALDVRIMEIVSVNRRSPGVRVKFVLKAATAAEAEQAALALDAYMVTPAFLRDLRMQQGNLKNVQTAGVDIMPTTSLTGPVAPPNAPSGSNPPPPPKGAGLEVAVVILSILLVIGLVAGGVYYYKSKYQGRDLEHEQARMFNMGDDGTGHPHAVTHDDGMGPSFAIPTAEVVGVSDPSWSTVRNEEDNGGAMAMQDFGGNQDQGSAGYAKPPDYLEDEDLEEGK